LEVPKQRLTSPAIQAGQLHFHEDALPGGQGGKLDASREIGAGGQSRTSNQAGF
jgi:hypothetical protein